MPRGKSPGPLLAVAPNFVDILQQRSFWGSCAGQFCGAYHLYFMLTWLPFYLVHERHLSAQDMAKITAVYYLVDAMAAIATGWITDCSIRNGFTTTVVRKSAMALGWSIAAVGLIGLALAGPHSYLGWLMVAGVGCGIGQSGTFTFPQTLAGPQAAGRWVGYKMALGISRG
jgi:Major Facilitator Superfamily.